MTQESYPLLRDAYAIIDGIPEDRFKLDSWRKARDPNNDNPSSCGTIGCAGGWLAMHPMMQERGLRSGRYGVPVIPAVDGMSLGPYRSLAAVLGISLWDSEQLFGTRACERSYDPVAYESKNLSDKEFWKARVRNFLKVKDELKEQDEKHFPRSTRCNVGTQCVGL